VDGHIMSVDSHTMSVDSHTMSVDSQTMSVDIHTMSVDSHIMSVDNHTLNTLLEKLTFSAMHECTAFCGTMFTKLSHWALPYRDEPSPHPDMLSLSRERQQLHRVRKAHWLLRGILFASVLCTIPVLSTS